MGRRSFAILALFFCVMAGGGLWAARKVRAACWWEGEAGSPESGRVCPGLRVGGAALAGSDVDRAVDELGHHFAARQVQIVVSDRSDASLQTSFGELGASLDLARLSALIHSVGHRGALLERFTEARQASRGQLDLPLLVTVDPAKFLPALDALKDVVDELPVAARLDLAHGDGAIFPHVPGRFLDLNDALEQVRAAALAGQHRVVLQRIEIAPRVSREYLAQVNVHTELARFQTGFSRAGEQESRARNVENAAAKLDGVVLLPHQLFSFNDVVGPRTVENGFSKGWEIFKGEMVQGIGGGTCQAASTLHAVAYLSGLDVLERLPHSRPSAYITMGLDATVVYPVVDLKLRNPYDFPIVVHSFIEGNTVHMSLLGRERPAQVTFGREVLSTRPFTRKVEEMPGLADNRVIRKQHGIRGYRILRSRTIAYRDGTRRSESNVDVYPPTLEMYLVAPGVDPDAVLPPLVPEPEDPSASGESAPSAEGRAMSSLVVSPASDAAPTRPKIVEAPGAHAPMAAQLRAPTRVVIGSSPLR